MEFKWPPICTLPMFQCFEGPSSEDHLITVAGRQWRRLQTATEDFFVAVTKLINSCISLEFRLHLKPEYKFIARQCLFLRMKPTNIIKLSSKLDLLPSLSLPHVDDDDDDHSAWLTRRQDTDDDQRQRPTTAAATTTTTFRLCAVLEPKDESENDQVCLSSTRDSAATTSRLVSNPNLLRVASLMNFGDALHQRINSVSFSATN